MRRRDKDNQLEFMPLFFEVLHHNYEAFEY